jgi:tRNA pseudouridine32 synthase/23S rRNA pseudouridine746 synthase
MQNPRREVPVVHESGSFLVVDKPSGWLSVPSRQGEEDERPCVGIFLQKESGRRIWPVHRLDLEVSGLLVFALNADAHRAASAWFEGREIRKTYDALVLSEEVLEHAAPGKGLERWESRLLRGKKRAYEHVAGKPSVTEARRLGPVTIAGSAAERWELHPLTGRAHQLRYEMGRRVGPLWGDALYGSKKDFPRPGIGLRAVRLDFGRIADRLGLPERLEVEGL